MRACEYWFHNLELFSLCLCLCRSSLYSSGSDMSGPITPQHRKYISSSPRIGERPRVSGWVGGWVSEWESGVGGLVSVWRGVLCGNGLLTCSDSHGCFLHFDHKFIVYFFTD